MASLKLNTSYKHHLICASILAIWLVSFLILIAPFDVSDLSFAIRLQILPPYGLLTLVGYMVLVPLQNRVFKQYGRWTVALEVSFLLVFNLMLLGACFMYYQSDIINGEYPFTKFTLEVYYPIFFIVLPLLVLSRWYLNKKAPDPDPDSGKIVLTGENKLDVLNLNRSDLISISSADNYIEIHYLLNQELRTKLLRTSLKTIHEQHPVLLKVHRSHLINPMHFKEWKDANTIVLTQLELPVSKNYKKSVLALDHSPLKAQGSSQNL